MGPEGPSFLLTQDLVQLRAVLALDEFRVYQVSVGELEARMQLRFPEVAQEAGTLPVVPAADSRKPLAAAADIAR